jgi:hypothetical protein
MKATRTKTKARRTHELKQSRFVHLVRKVVNIAASRTMFVDLEKAFYEKDVYYALARDDSKRLFQWFVEAINFQGISDSAAQSYIDKHGLLTWYAISNAVRRQPSCPKLTSYWTFTDCGYQKLARCCNQKSHFKKCPLPTFDMRNGRLNQSAFSLYFFFRDVAEGDFIAWLDRSVAEIISVGIDDRSIHRLLIEPLGNVFGISDKVVSLALSYLFIGCGPVKPNWLIVGGHMVVIDSLVHNFLHRTGTLRSLKADHKYGPGCYLPGRCRDLIKAASQKIDASKLNPAYPKTFPRLVQQSLWRFCAAEHFDTCNGNVIDDRKRCRNTTCELFVHCDRQPLKPPKRR